MKLSEPGSSAASDRVSASGIQAGNTPSDHNPKHSGNEAPRGRNSGWLVIGFGFLGVFVAMIGGAFLSGFFDRGSGIAQKPNAWGDPCNL